jgi:hypothetical protein
MQKPRGRIVGFIGNLNSSGSTNSLVSEIAVTRQLRFLFLAFYCEFPMGE